MFAVECGSVHLFAIITSGENAVMALGVVSFGYRSMSSVFERVNTLRVLVWLYFYKWNKEGRKEGKCIYLI